MQQMTAVATQTATRPTAAGPSEGFVPVREAEERLSLSRNSVLRRVKLGILQGYQDPDNGYFYVKASSIDEALRRRELARRAAETPFVSKKSGPHRK